MNGVLDFDGSVRITIEPLEEQESGPDTSRTIPAKKTNPTNQPKPSTSR